MATLGRVAKRSEILRQHKVMYCEVYKAGSTAWNSLMAHLYGKSKIIETKEFYRMQPLLKPSLQVFMKTLKDEHFVRLVVAREPLSRLLSAYRDRIEDTSHPSWQGSHYAPLILQYSRGKTFAKNEMYYANKTIKIVPTFDEFIRYLVKTKPATYDPHWMPITLQCSVCNINYTHIIHTETFIDDVRYILRETGLNQKIDASLLTLNAHKGKGNTGDLMMTYYSTVKPPSLQKIIDIYKDDFVYFDYNPIEVLKNIFPNETFKFS
ncbi:hypothetical protein SK128_016037 [Halocaridina rubra]|uniref:Carbohydrate sulfotransferase n=1 Tax=Halocaridina rubra TaxID=373956 RepID=A0AAN8XAN6_HALRR